MFEDELASINAQINKWKSKTGEEVNVIKESMLDTLYAMKKSVERKIQKYEMERELDRRFDNHIESHQSQFKEKGMKLSRTFSRDNSNLQDEIAISYEAASSKKVEENFENAMHEMWQINKDFALVVSTCMRRGF